MNKMTLVFPESEYVDIIKSLPVFLLETSNPIKEHFLTFYDANTIFLTFIIPPNLSIGEAQELAKQFCLMIGS